MEKVHQQLPFIIIDNEDDSYDVFVKNLIKSGLISEFKALKCTRIVPLTSDGTRIKNFEIDFQPYQNEYQVSFLNHRHFLKFQRFGPKITTYMRKIQYIKRLTISGESIESIKAFVKHIFYLSEKIDEDLIVIYENSQGNWLMSKERRKRKLETVILHENLMEQICADVQQFRDNEKYYLQLGIPYKRSYLFYGPPGTGKSSLALAIASKFNLTICFVNCSDNINDFQFNQLLITAPKQSLILIEDIDSMFSQRKNSDQLNAITFSGFLNAMDGVRSQEGRIAIMTTNHRQKLDPAILRPGRTDQMFYIALARQGQIERLCYNFFKDRQLAKQFSEGLPEGKFSMSMIQGYLVKYRKNKLQILQNIEDLQLSDQNTSIHQFLREINCYQILSDFQLQECDTLARVRNLGKQELEKIADKLPKLKRERLIQTVHCERRLYIRTKKQQIERYIIEFTAKIKAEKHQKKLIEYCQNHKCISIYQIQDTVNQWKQKDNQIEVEK